MTKYIRIYVGTGKKVHLANEVYGNRPQALCGAGENSFGSRRRSANKVTTDPLTCTKCTTARFKMDGITSK